MVYEYSGYLKNILNAPDASIRESLPGIVFTADDLAEWKLNDDRSEPEWVHIPVNRARSEYGVRLEGLFEDVRRIDNLTADDPPGFWVSLSSLGWDDDRFPIDTSKYPIAEVTYRCVTTNARPAWLWSYPGGDHLDRLAPTQAWRTVARRVAHFGAPALIDALTFRLYSTSRTTESIEIESVRFRESSPAENEACSKDQVLLESPKKAKAYPILDEFLPIGCFMDAGTTKRLAAMLGVSLHEYWLLVLEDMVRHNHNTIALQKVDRFAPDEWQDLLALAETFGVKFVAMHDLPVGAGCAHGEAVVENHIKPYADSSSILAWSLCDDVPERGFHDLMRLRPHVEEADPNHPLAVIIHRPNAFPLFAPFFAASGIAHFRSHAPWRLSKMVRTHLPLSGGQQFWVVAPGFIQATDTPEWHTASEMRLMINSAFAGGARGWFTFCYHNDPVWIRGSCQRSLTGPFLTFSDLWSELGQRTMKLNALAPLFLKASPAEEASQWFATRSIAHANTQIPEGVPPATQFSLRGAEFELFCIVSNDVREMTTVHIDVAASAVEGMALYDLSEFVQTRTWAPMEHKRHLEMFPGQFRIILAAKLEVCEHWRDVIANRMVEIDRRQLAFDLALIRAYGREVPSVERMVEEGGQGPPMDDLAKMQRARDTLLDLIYDTPAICETRTSIIEANAAVCACDGALCRLQAREKADPVRELGLKVIPLARQFTNMRLELRRGNGGAILEECRQLAKRVRDLLTSIRSVP